MAVENPTNGAAHESTSGDPVEQPRAAPRRGWLAARVDRVRSVWRDVQQLRELPLVSIDLAYQESLANDPFFPKLVLAHYRDARRRHPKMPLLRKFSHGVAVCRLPETFEEYFAKIDAAARRNVKKARRLGYGFARIDMNEHLDEMADIVCSTDVRQGSMPRELLEFRPKSVDNPASRTTTHDYAYFGVLREGRLFAYLGCMIAGEFCGIEQIFGHAKFQGDAVVPLLIVSLAEHLRTAHPRVKFYAYGGYFGAQETMRRFKRKFLFLPHRVDWLLG